MFCYDNGMLTATRPVEASDGHSCVNGTRLGMEFCSLQSQEVDHSVLSNRPDTGTP